jgi:type II secretory pathway component PulF
LSNFPKLFPSLYVSLVKSGEASGRLDEALEELAEFIDKEEELKSKIRTALAYPALMIVVGIATVFVLVSFVIPKLAGMFADFGQALPLPTRILINISDIFARYWLWLLLIGVAIIVLVVKRGVTATERLAIDRIKLRLPLVGGIVRKQIIVRFARTLALLLRSGIPVFQALEVTTPIMGNEVFARELEDVRKEVVDGSSLATSMRKKLCFPSFVSNMVGVGEEGGRLDKVLAEVASAYSREVDSKVKVAISLLEPAIILVLGLVVGFIVLAMLLPILQLTLLVK